ncbi:MAG: Major facilitator superfamily MFS-1 [uncultured Sulfurovum sp.]|uniref:Major facilitator superfamily MFS-1 n=1 Tax=uncultured Sulfurovum sp. TaxID=269237 RepID=A0A6S6U454_9BACT|nr:MAG: Major facilitator superfamily MFS-1 [uncultured Sulfurovum sp.]
MFLSNNPNLNKLSYGFALLFIAIGSILQYITPYFYAQGKEDMGFKILIILYFCIFTANFIAPYFIRRFGSQKMIVLTTIAYIVSIVAMIMDNTFVIYTGTILLGLAGAILWNSQNNYLVGISNAHNRGANSGFFVAVYGVGYALGIVVLGYLIEMFSYQDAFYMMIIFAFGGLYLFVKMDTLEGEVREKSSDSIFMIRSLTLFKSVLSSSFIQSILFGLVISLVPLHVQIVTQSPMYVGILSAMFFIMPLLLSMVIGKFSDKHGRGKIILLGVLIALLGLLAFHFSETLLGLVVAMVLVSIAQAILFPMFIALQGDISTKENQALITNLFVLFKYIGMVLGVILGDVFGVEWAYMISVVIIIVVLLFSFRVLLDDKVLKLKIFNEMSGVNKHAL